VTEGARGGHGPTGDADIPGPPPVAATTAPTGSTGSTAPTARTETIVGLALVVVVLLAALWFRHRPAAVFLDDWGTSLFRPDPHGAFWRHITELRRIPIFVGGSVLAAAVVAGRDRRRALACAVAPALAVLLTEYLVKPVIARRYLGALAFPSGTTTAIASLATAWAIAVPPRLRPPVVAVGAVLVGLACAAVTALQWHLPTDALGGALFGAGVVLVVDGVLHLERGPGGALTTRRRRSTRSAVTAPGRRRHGPSTPG